MEFLANRFKIASLTSVLNQCCSEVPLKILFQQHRSNSVMPVMSAARPLFPRKRKLIPNLAMSHSCQEPTYAAQQNDVRGCALFDHLVGAREQRRRNFEAE